MSILYINSNSTSIDNTSQRNNSTFSDIGNFRNIINNHTLESIYALKDLPPDIVSKILERGTLF